MNIRSQSWEGWGNFTCEALYSIFPHRLTRTKGPIASWRATGWSSKANLKTLDARASIGIAWISTPQGVVDVLLLLFKEVRAGQVSRRE